MNTEDEEFNRIEREAKQRMEAVRAAVSQPSQQEPFGYFKAEPFGWTDCAETDEGAIALYERPPAQRTWVEVEQVKWEGDKLIAKLKEKNNGN